jgi:hypothetical protein
MEGFEDEAERREDQQRPPAEAYVTVRVVDGSLVVCHSVCPLAGSIVLDIP